MPKQEQRNWTSTELAFLKRLLDHGLTIREIQRKHFQYRSETSLFYAKYYHLEKRWYVKG